MKKIKIGLLPLYIKLYDDVGTDRTYTKAFYDTIAGILKNQNFDVIKSDFCRVKSEFDEVVNKFEVAGADVIVTLHMAYSPSLESIDALANTKLPIVVLDSTEAYELNKMASSNPVGNNHGIHGVMDICNLLSQRGKPFAIAAGHIADGKVIKKTSDFIKAAVAARALKDSRVGAFGSSFKGMGDFLISKEEAKNIFGIDIVSFSEEQMSTLLNSITKEEIDEEKLNYEKEFTCAKIKNEVLDRAVKSALAVRKGIAENELDAFSINFLDVANKNLGSMPFVECCKEMQRGIGYAGEGDVLTASFVGALLKSFKEVSFVEIFCPDWKNNKLLISHMGEMNYCVAKEKPTLLEFGFPFTDINSVVKGLACFKSGKAVFCNVNKGKLGKYKLLLSDIEMLEEVDGFEDKIRGWFRPDIPIDDFLEKLSELGATHHSFIVYDVSIKALEYFGKLIGLDVLKI